MLLGNSFVSFFLPRRHCTMYNEINIIPFSFAHIFRSDISSWVWIQMHYLILSIMLVDSVHYQSLSYCSLTTIACFRTNVFWRNCQTATAFIEHKKQLSFVFNWLSRQWFPLSNHTSPLMVAPLTSTVTVNVIGLKSNSLSQPTSSRHYYHPRIPVTIITLELPSPSS